MCIDGTAKNASGVCEGAPGLGCGNETFVGRCLNETFVVFCQDEQVQTLQCDGGTVCGLADDIYDCVGFVDACSGISTDGTCDGSALIYCGDNGFGEGQLYRRDCSLEGKECVEFSGLAACATDAGAGGGPGERVARDLAAPCSCRAPGSPTDERGALTGVALLLAAALGRRR